MKNIRRFVRNFVNALMRPEMLVLPGQLAFFFFLQDSGGYGAETI